MIRALVTASTFLLLCSSQPASPCTIFNAMRGGLVLAGNNEDLMSTDAMIWFYPPSAGKNGFVYVGFKTYGIQGGMNDEGLFIDFNALKFARMKNNPEKPRIPEGDRLVDRVMQECATVDDVINLFDTYNLGFWGPYQIMLADRSGGAAVLGADKQGDLSITRKQKDYLVSTNFSLANPEFGSSSYPCYRYDTASRMLENMQELTVDYFRKILAATHQEGDYPTAYSNICDLTHGDIYLYNFHFFEEVVKFNLQEEFRKGEHSYEFSSLFPLKTHAQKTFEEAQPRRLSNVLLKTMLSKGMDAAIRQFQDIKHRYGSIPAELENLAFSLRLKGKTDEMIGVYKLYLQEFPKSPVGHRRLGDLYLRTGKETQAIQSYESALALDPKNAEVRVILKTLGKDKSP